VTIVRGALSDDGVWRAATEGVTHVVHALVDARAHLDYDALAPLNLHLSARVFEAARAVSARCVVFLSEARLYAPADRYVAEQGAVRPTDTAAQSLYDAEILLRGLANRSPDAPRLIVLRRTRLYGHREPLPEAPWWALPPVLAQYFELIPGVAGGPRSQWLHLDDLARAALHVAALEGLERVSTFNVADDTPLTVGETFNLVIEAYGFPVGIKVPYPSPPVLSRALQLFDGPLVRAALDALLRRQWRTAAGPTEREVIPSLGQAILWGLTEDLLVDNDRLKATGFSLRHPDSRQSLPEVFARYQREGLLPRERPGDGNTEGRDLGLGSTFAERMRGYLRWAHETGAVSHPFAFEVRMTAPGVRLPVSDGLWNLDGVLRAESLANEARIRGTLEVAAHGKRRLLYEFGFTGDDGHHYRFEGVKRLRLRDLKRSLTEMPFRLLDERGTEVATGEMRFDVRRDLADFLRSFGLARMWFRGEGEG
jgi:nucleoside-diphosphate-sugar epimerase